MALNATALKGDLKSALITLFNECKEGEEGMKAADYADKFATIIAEKVVTHIQINAEVATTVTGTAGPYPVTGAGTGKVS
jgi:hypothetical protein